MKKFLLMSIIFLIGIGVNAQTGGIKVASKVYLKNGEIKEGRSMMNVNNTRIKVMGIGVRIKGKKFMKEIKLKPKGGKRMKISIDQIDKIEYLLPAKMFSKEVKTVTYKPMEIEGETILAKEIVANKLYSVHKLTAVTLGNDTTTENREQGQQNVYYLNKGGKYVKTTLASIKKKYNCSMEEGKGREDKIAQCLKGK